MFACALYPSDEEFLSNVEQEVIEQVTFLYIQDSLIYYLILNLCVQITRTRSHPSILIYSGNNELEMGIQGGWWYGSNYTKKFMIQDYAKLMKTVIKSVQKADPTALIIRSSPSNGNLDE